jgi:UDP-glucose 4-epimerase
MRVLVTGGAGFIGGHIVEHFQGSAEVRVLDDLRSGSLANLSGFKYEFLEGTVLDRELVRRAVEGVDYIFHLAALASVPESMADPATCHAINVDGMRIVLEEAAAAGVKKLCFASSAAIYGNNPTVPKREEMVPEPASPYAESKLAGERLCEEFSDRIGAVSLRFFNVFGPRQNPRSSYAAAVPIFIRKALANEAIVVHGDGEQTRDFVYVGDVVAACVFAVTNSEASGVYNVGYGESITINELARKIIALAGSKSELSYTPTRAGDVKHSLASVERLHAAGFRPTGSVAEGLAITLAAEKK